MTNYAEPKLRLFSINYSTFQSFLSRLAAYEVYRKQVLAVILPLESSSYNDATLSMLRHTTIKNPEYISPSNPDISFSHSQ